MAVKKTIPSKPKKSTIVSKSTISSKVNKSLSKPSIVSKPKKSSSKTPSSSKTLINSPSKTPSKTLSKTSYLNYLKQHKNKFLTSSLIAGALLTTGALYIKFNRKKVLDATTQTINKQVDKALEKLDEIKNEIKNDPKYADIASDITSQTIIKVVDNYKQELVNTIGNNINSITNTTGNILDAMQNGIASVMVPPIIQAIPDLQNNIQNAVIQGVVQTTLNVDKIKKIEDYLIKIEGINKNCTKNFKETNIMPGDFNGKCTPEDEKKIYEQVLKYYSDPKLYKKIEYNVDPVTLKKAEKYVTDNNSVEANCTQNFYTWSSALYGCKNQKEADELIASAFDMIKSGQIKI